MNDNAKQTIPAFLVPVSKIQNNCQKIAQNYYNFMATDAAKETTLSKMGGEKDAACVKIKEYFQEQINVMVAEIKVWADKELQELSELGGNPVTGPK